MTLPSRHWIQNSNPGGLRPSSLSLGHIGSPQYWIFTSEQRRSMTKWWHVTCLFPKQWRNVVFVAWIRPISHPSSTCRCRDLGFIVRISRWQTVQSRATIPHNHGMVINSSVHYRRKNCTLQVFRQFGALNNAHAQLRSETSSPESLSNKMDALLLSSHTDAWCFFSLCPCLLFFQKHHYKRSAGL